VSAGQTTREKVCEMDQSVSQEEKRQTQMHRSRAIQIPGAPPEAESHDEIRDTKITYKV
jgi:hypothetical protein